MDLVKIDVDGFESRILHGADRALRAGRIRHLIVEFNPFWLEKSGASAESLEAYLRDCGFRDASGGHRAAAAVLGRSEDRVFSYGR